MNASDVLSPVIATTMVFVASHCGVSYEATADGVPEQVVMPSIEEHPQTTTVPLGQPARFTAWATDRRLVRYQWKRDGVDIEGAVGPTLALPPVSERDGNAQFWVVVSNGIAAVASRRATLRVTPGPAALPCDSPMLDARP